jgi:hypothetical protein
MATNTTLSTAARNAAAGGIAALLDAGPGAATIKIYTGTQPAGPGTAVSGQTLLGTLTCSDPAFGAASNGVSTASAITSDTSADASGTAAWFRAADSTGLAVIDGSVGTSAADMILSSVNIVLGGTIAITSWTITMPAS